MWINHQRRWKKEWFLCIKWTGISFNESPSIIEIQQIWWMSRHSYDAEYYLIVETKIDLLRRYLPSDDIFLCYIACSIRVTMYESSNKWLRSFKFYWTENILAVEVLTQNMLYLKLCVESLIICIRNNYSSHYRYISTAIHRNISTTVETFLLLHLELCVE